MMTTQKYLWIFKVAVQCIHTLCIHKRNHPAGHLRVNLEELVKRNYCKQTRPLPGGLKAPLASALRLHCVTPSQM